MVTAKQHQVYQFITYYIQKHGYAPTETEIATGIGIKSRGVAHRYVTALAKAGMIQVTAGKRRNITLVNAPPTTLFDLPLLGQIAAGHPMEAIENNEVIDVSKKLLKSNSFILKVKGDSMIGDNICDGDYIVCESAQNIPENAIAVVLIDHQEVTLKRIRKNKNNTVTLLASNPEVSPMIYAIERIQIQGIYLGLLRFQM